MGGLLLLKTNITQKYATIVEILLPVYLWKGGFFVGQ